MSETHSHIETALQDIRLERLRGDGLILDIGGGGEGLVSRIENERVCAIDIRMSEIREAQIHGQSANWIVADARNLCFREEVFDVATLWFSLGFMSDWTTKHSVIEGAYHVLRKGGQISILASHIPVSSASLIFWANFTLPDGTLSKTGYGIKGGQNQTLARVSDLVDDVGFVRHQSEDHGDWFKLVAHKR